MGYSPWGHKESDMTERLTRFHTLTINTIRKLSLWCFQTLPYFVRPCNGEMRS